MNCRDVISTPWHDLSMQHRMITLEGVSACKPLHTRAEHYQFVAR